MSGHGLTVEDVNPAEQQNHDWRTKVDQISAALGKRRLTDDALAFALWECTAFPVAPVEYTGWQLAAFIVTANNDAFQPTDD